MSSNSLQQNLQRLEASPKSEQKAEEAKKSDVLRKAVKKSIKDVDKSREKLLNLKNKVRKLDPNQESVNNLKVKISTSQLHLLGPL